MSSSVPSLPSRTLRCANGALYLLMALGVEAALVYAWCAGRLEGPLLLALGCCGGCVALIWALWYATLCFRVDASGVSRRVLWSVRSRRWADLKEAHASESEERGVVSCCIRLVFEEGVWCIGSDLFSPDEVQGLREDLRAAGLLRI